MTPPNRARRPPCASMTLDKHQRFALPAYANKRPFTGFLPGIAGPLGIPMWVFYVNRGQAVCSFGIENKNHPLMEFQPANKAYQQTPLLGFRTFMRLGAETKTAVYEPFGVSNGQDVSRQMLIGLNELELQEENHALGLRTNVLYFTLVGEPFAGLVRQVTITNTGTENRKIELLDGTPVFLPYGVDNRVLKEMGRTIEAWMEVEYSETDITCFRLRASADDSAEVRQVTGANYSLGYFRSEPAGPFRSLQSLVDPARIFGQDTSFQRPEIFYRKGLSGLMKETQVTVGRTPCCFYGISLELPAGHSADLASVFGYAGSLEQLHIRAGKIAAPGFLSGKREEGNALVQEITSPIQTRSAVPLFDAYARQTFLDNVLRGGYPMLAGDRSDPQVIHLYTRKHGDPERDYNFFSLSASFFSQGEGNYRDVAQNRRNNVRFFPRIGRDDIDVFMSLIQLDGYNPLVLEGTRFSLERSRADDLLEKILDRDHQTRMKIADFVTKPFTPGELFSLTTAENLQIPIEPEQFMNLILAKADREITARFGEGFWIDHWTYNLDLIEAFLSIYPEQLQELLHGKPGLPFYESPAVVQPRHRKYVWTEKGTRQYNAVVEDPEKIDRIQMRPERKNWARIEHGHGEIYFATLFVKLYMLVCMKAASLDPFGMGVEMEAGKPGWYDALNGLPGLFGSSMPETYEILRLSSFLQDALERTEPGDVRVPVEFYDFQVSLQHSLEMFLNSANENRDFERWDQVSIARENYRDRTRLGLAGPEHSIHHEELVHLLQTIEKVIRLGIDRAAGFSEGLAPTYFRFEMTRHAHIHDESGQPGEDTSGRELIRPLEFTAIPLPAFLEGPVRLLKITENEASARGIIASVENSKLLDPKLKMYKVNAPLEKEPHEIGRARAFPPGWLENESIWLHMQYKYLLAMLQSEQYEAFWKASKQTLIPFLDPARYGRSTLENSSFLASSAHPDAALHGSGFVARLSGSTAEFLSIWTVVMFGKTPFRIRNGSLVLSLRPALPGWFFPEDGPVEATFLGRVRVLIHNPKKIATWTAAPREVRVSANNEQISFKGDAIPSPYAEMVRSGSIPELQIVY